MSKIKAYLKAVDAKINEVQPKTMDELLNIHVAGGETYGHQYYIIKYMGVTQGVRIGVIGRNVEHILPAPDMAYGVLQGLDKFIENGWCIVHVDATGKAFMNEHQHIDEIRKAVFKKKEAEVKGWDEKECDSYLMSNGSSGSLLPETLSAKRDLIIDCEYTYIMQASLNDLKTVYLS